MRREEAAQIHQQDDSSDRASSEPVPLENIDLNLDDDVFNISVVQDDDKLVELEPEFLGKFDSIRPQLYFLYTNFTSGNPCYLFI